MKAMSASAKPGPGETSKLLTPLASAAITAVTTIVVALIGIVPQLRSRDNHVAYLQQQLEELKNPMASIKTAQGTWTIAGNIRSTAVDTTRHDKGSGAEVSLVPRSLVTTTDSTGDYAFGNVQPGEYLLLVRHLPRESFTIGLSSDKPTSTVGPIDGYTVTYSRRDGD